MIANFLVVAGNVGTLFLIMGIGFALAKLGKLGNQGISQLSYITLYIVAPCVVADSFAVPFSSALLSKMGQFFLFYTLASLFCIFATARAFPKEPEARRAPMRFGMIYGNNGFMGLPLVQSVLGPGALMYGVVSLVVFNCLLWSNGIKIIGGKITLRQALINPATIGLAVGLPLFLTGLRLPGPLSAAVHHVANLNTPLAMIVIGAQMAGVDLKKCATSLRLYKAAAFRLLLAPLPVLLLLPLLGADPMVYQTCVIMCAVPTAGATAMLAQRFERDTAVAAQMVSLSTLLSIITLPIMATIAKMLIS